MLNSPTYAEKLGVSWEPHKESLLERSTPWSPKYWVRLPLLFPPLTLNFEDPHILCNYETCFETPLGTWPGLVTQSCCETPVNICVENIVINIGLASLNINFLKSWTDRPLETMFCCASGILDGTSDKTFF